MKKYCSKCNIEQITKIIQKKQFFSVRGEKIEIYSDVRICSVCGENIFDEDLDEKTIINVYQEYRNKHNLLSPLEIKKVRSKYGSGRTVATLLGWSQATMVRYENGAIPDTAHHEQLLRLKNDPNYFRELLQQRGEKLKAQERYRLQSLVDSISTEDGEPDPVSMFKFNRINTNTSNQSIGDVMQSVENKLKSWSSPSRQGSSLYQKIVINHSYAEFNLSDEAWAAYGKVKPKDLNNISFRRDPDLIRVVEQLGEQANGQSALGVKSDLKIIEFPEGIPVRIESYDGNEWVAEEHRVWGKNI